MSNPNAPRFNFNRSPTEANAVDIVTKLVLELEQKSPEPEAALTESGLEKIVRQARAEDTAG